MPMAASVAAMPVATPTTTMPVAASTAAIPAATPNTTMSTAAAATPTTTMPMAATADPMPVAPLNRLKRKLLHDELKSVPPLPPPNTGHQGQDYYTRAEAMLYRRFRHNGYRSRW